MRIKRTLSLILALIMSLSMLTGCNSAGLGYLQLDKEMSNVKEFTFNVATELDVSVPTQNVDLKLDLDVKGEMDIEDLQDIYGSFELTPVLDGEKQEMVKLKLVDEKLYISPNVLKVALEVSKILGEEDAKITEGVNYMLSNTLQGVEYIVIDEESTEMFTYNDVPEDVKVEELQELVEDYIITVFGDFDFDLVEKVAKNHYEITINSEVLIDFILSLIDYISENKELFYDETVKLSIAWFEMSEMYTDEEIEMMKEEFETSRQEFYEIIDSLGIQIEAELENSKEYLEGLNAKISVKKEKDTYIEKVSASYVLDGQGSIYLSIDSTMIPKMVDKVNIDEDKVITAEELEVEFEKLERKLNPVTEMSIHWNSNNKYAVYSRVESVNKDLTTETTEYPYTVKEGRIYLPLRAICEAFGEDVEWDNEARKAYIVRDEEKIDMTGMIVNDRTMLKIRDFEKLGYTVDYTQTENGLSTATLKSNK